MIPGLMNRISLVSASTCQGEMSTKDRELTSNFAKRIDEFSSLIEIMLLIEIKRTGEIGLNRNGLSGNADLLLFGVDMMVNF